MRVLKSKKVSRSDLLAIRMYLIVSRVSDVIGIHGMFGQITYKPAVHSTSSHITVYIF